MLASDMSRLRRGRTPISPQARDIDYEAVVKLSDGFNGADLRNVCTEAGLFAIRAERDVILDEDMMKATRKLVETKKLEGTLEYKKM